MSKHRHLRPWVWAVIEVISGLGCALLVLWGWLYVIEAFTGINLLAVLEAI